MLIELFITLHLSPAPATDEASPPATDPTEQPHDAEDLKRVAQDLYESGRYSEARAVLAAAHAIDPDPGLLFAQARVARAQGQCAEAVALWNRYLETGPEHGAAELARRHIAECEEELEDPVPAVPAPSNPERELPEPPPPTPVVPPAPPKELPRVQTPTRPWYADPVGGSLLGVGLASSAIGGGLIGGAASFASRADDAATEREFSDQVVRGSQMNTAGVTLLTVGGALIVGSVIRYAVIAGRHRNRR